MRFEENDHVHDVIWSFDFLILSGKVDELQA